MRSSVRLLLQTMMVLRSPLAHRFLFKTQPHLWTVYRSPSTSVEANVTLEMIYSTSDIDSENLTTTFVWTDHPNHIGTNLTLTLDNSRPVGSTITATVTTSMTMVPVTLPQIRS